MRSPLLGLLALLACVTLMAVVRVSAEPFAGYYPLPEGADAVDDRKSFSMSSDGCAGIVRAWKEDMLANFKRRDSPHFGIKRSGMLGVMVVQVPNAAGDATELHGLYSLSGHNQWTPDPETGKDRTPRSFLNRPAVDTPTLTTLANSKLDPPTRVYRVGGAPIVKWIEVGRPTDAQITTWGNTLTAAFTAPPNQIPQVAPRCFGHHDTTAKCEILTVGGSKSMKKTFADNTFTSGGSLGQCALAKLSHHAFKVLGLASTQSVVCAAEIQAVTQAQVDAMNDPKTEKYSISTLTANTDRVYEWSDVVSSCVTCQNSIPLLVGGAAGWTPFKAPGHKSKPSIKQRSDAKKLEKQQVAAQEAEAAAVSKAAATALKARKEEAGADEERKQATPPPQIHSRGPAPVADLHRSSSSASLASSSGQRSRSSSPASRLKKQGPAPAIAKAASRTPAAATNQVRPRSVPHNKAADRRKAARKALQPASAAAPGPSVMETVCAWGWELGKSCIDGICSMVCKRTPAAKGK